MRFRLLNIPVSVEPWFFIGLFFIYTMAGGSTSGGFAAIGVGVFTLIHEFGHALVARSYGCTVAVKLNLFVGWATYSAQKPLRRRQSILVSLAGPGSQLLAGIATLAVVYWRFQTSPSETVADAWWGLSFAGITIALMNLLPLWPLDGGHVVQRVLERFLPGVRAVKATIWLTFALLAAMIVAGTMAKANGAAAHNWFGDRWRSAYSAMSDSIRQPSFGEACWGAIRGMEYFLLDLPAFLMMVCGLSSLQTLGALKQQHRVTDDANALTAAHEAEIGGWHQGVVPAMPKGWQPSPWLKAYVQARLGDDEGAAQELRHVGGEGRWILPAPESRPELAMLVPLMPGEVALSDREHSYTLANVLSFYGLPAQFLELSSALYGRYRDPELLYRAAAGLARRGYPDDAVSWLRRATVEAPDPKRIARDPSFLSLRGRPDFDQLARAGV